MSVTETCVMEVKPWQLPNADTGKLWKSQWEEKMAYYPDLTFSSRSFFTFNLVLTFEKWLKYIAVSSSWMNQLLNIVAPVPQALFSITALQRGTIKSYQE